MEDFKRVCPACKTILTYKNKYGRNRAEKNNKICLKCAGVKKRHKYLGKSNHFFGKRHTEDAKLSISKANKGKNLSAATQFKKGNISGGNFKKFWKDKYPTEIYLEKLKNFKEKQSHLNSGSLNNMYGKPSPKGSGNGWSGWYKGWFFRSLNELSYVIQILERFNLRWETGEQIKYRISYKDNGIKRNYFPDFIVENKYMVECKPKRLWNSLVVLKKKMAAEAFCKKHHLKYKLVECSKLPLEKINLLVREKIINFTPRYETKFENYYFGGPTSIG